MKNIFFLLILALSFNQSGYTDPMLSAYYGFEYGKYYYILADGVRIRSQPNLNGEIIGRLSVNSRIKIISMEVLENTLIIDDVAAHWYLIEYENITGYIWGGYIAECTFIYDIDNNGIDDYFHSRVSSISGFLQHRINSLTDVFIYINNRRIPTTNIVSINPRNNRTYHTWGACFFKLSERNTVLIHMYISDHGYKLDDIFEIDRTGRITLIERTETFYESDY